MISEASETFETFQLTNVFAFTARNMTTAKKMEYKFETLSVTEAKPFVYHVAFNRPDRLNAFNRTMWL